MGTFYTGKRIHPHTHTLFSISLETAHLPAKVDSCLITWIRNQWALAQLLNLSNIKPATVSEHWVQHLRKWNNPVVMFCPLWPKSQRETRLRKGRCTAFNLSPFWQVAEGNFCNGGGNRNVLMVNTVKTIKQSLQVKQDMDWLEKERD